MSRCSLCRAVSESARIRAFCDLQACAPYDPVEAGRARLEALLWRLQEMGFGLEAAKGALKAAWREGLTDQPALERAVELLAGAGSL